MALSCTEFIVIESFVTREGKWWDKVHVWNDLEVW